MAKIRLSQCMIVKNEERNIRKALSWGKGVVCEQIVVDTGSTDETVNIARSMGAKVYHFEWNDDFAAAKNFAIRKASGDWIAFLDADEYFQDGDAERMWYFLDQFTKEHGKVPAIVTTPLINLDDSGKPNCVIPKPRIFSNCGGIHYVKPVHEYLAADQKLYNVEVTDVSIYHTGYTKEAYESTQKAKRNRRLLDREMERDPEDPWNYCYMADICALEKDKKSALEYYKKAIEAYHKFDHSKRDAMDVLVCSAYYGILKTMYEMGEAENEEFIREYEAGLALSPDFPDLDLWRGSWEYKEENWAGAVRYLEQGIEKQNGYEGAAPCTFRTQLKGVSKFIMISAMNLGDKNRVLKYSIMGLKLDRYSEEHFAPLVSVLSSEASGTDRSGVLGFLKKLYDFSNLKDLLFLYKCAKLLNDEELQKTILEQMPSQQRSRLSAGEKTILPVTVTVSNSTDKSFVNLMGQVQRLSPEEVERDIRGGLETQKEKNSEWYRIAERFTSRFPYPGVLEKTGDRQTLPELRARILKSGEEWFCRLYEKLADFRSKQTLLSVLSNFYYLDPEFLTKAQDRGMEFVDPDITGSLKGAVFVDIGAFKGDVTKQFSSFYTDYGRIYCYEASEEAANYLAYSAYAIKNTEIRRTALFSGTQTAYLVKNPYGAATNFVTAVRPKAGDFKAVGTVALDEDLDEAAGMIVIDTAGCEREVLEGCARQIRENHPVLSVDVCSKPENLYRVFQTLEEMESGYSYYLRYYGGNVLPEKCILYAVKR